MTAWIAEHSETVADFFKLLMSLAGGIFAEGGPVQAFVRQHGEKAIAAASLCFGIWRWWVYREGILHKRLVEYINESDRRLGPASAAAVEMILRPGRASLVPSPAFALEMDRLLARNSLGRNATSAFFGLLNIETPTQGKLSRELKRLRERHSVARDAEQSLREQQAQLHLIRGAISVARARAARSERLAKHHDIVALHEFRRVLQFPGHARDVVAKENEAMQLFRLKRFAAAVAAFDALEVFATDLADRRHQDILIARCMRFRGQILQIQALPKASDTARAQLIAPENAIDDRCSTNLRAAHQPFERWELIEQAEIHYVAAWMASLRGAVQKSSTQLNLSSRAYGEVLANLPPFRWLMTAAQKRLWREARAGLARAEAGKQGKFDNDWLGV